MSTLFVVQNDTHAKNFNILALEAIARGEEVAIVLLDGATHESNDRFFDRELTPYIGAVERTIWPFYRSSGVRRTGMCIRFKTWARERIGTFDHVVVGNDGALQRIIIKAARSKNGDCRARIVLDGLLTRERGLRALVKRKVQRLGEWLDMDEFVPSTVGVSRLVDEITVMHASVAEVLRFHGVSADRISVAPLPRHAAILGAMRREETGKQKARILFLGSAYLWHGERVGHERQCSDFEAFAGFASCSPQFDCRLRIHPRDDVAQYENIGQDCMQISDKTVRLEEDLEWADIVVSSRSSGLFDATLAGKRTYVYTAHFPAPEEDTFLRSLQHISKFEEIHQ